MFAQLPREQVAVLLRAARVAAGFGIADLRQREQRLHHHALCGVALIGRRLRAMSLVRELGQRCGQKRSDEADRRNDWREELPFG